MQLFWNNKKIRGLIMTLQILLIERQDIFIIYPALDSVTKPNYFLSGTNQEESQKTRYMLCKDNGWLLSCPARLYFTREWWLRFVVMSETMSPVSMSMAIFLSDYVFMSPTNCSLSCMQSIPLHFLVQKLIVLLILAERLKER